MEKKKIIPEGLRGEKYLLKASLHHKAFSWLCRSKAGTVQLNMGNAGVTAVTFYICTPIVSIVEYML